MSEFTKAQFALWKKSFVDWSQSDYGFYVPQRWDEVKCDWIYAPADTGFPIRWQPFQERLFRTLLTLDDHGRLPFTALWYIDVKKSGKTTFGAALAQWCGMFHERNADIQIAANSLSQADVRVYQQLSWSLKHHPYQQMIAQVQNQEITFYKTGNVARPIPSKATTQAGGNPVLVDVDEPWGFTTQADREFLDELATSPTHKISVRVFQSYPPYEDDDGPMQDVLNRAYDSHEQAREGWEPLESLEDLPIIMKDGVAIWWNHEATRYPWHTPQYLAQVRADPTVSDASFSRFYLTHRAPRTSAFMPMDRWDSCTDPDWQPLGPYDRRVPVVLSIDLMGGKVWSDCAAAVARSYNPGTGRYELRGLKLWDPKVINDPNFDFNLAAEEWILDWHRTQHVLGVYFDPTQFVSSDKKLRKLGVKMFEVTQNNMRVVADTHYRGLIINRLLRNFPQSQDLRQHVARALAREDDDGTIRIVKRHAQKRIDLAVADSMCCYGCFERKAEFERLARQHEVVIKPPPRREDRFASFFRLGKG